jgi:hypothetical protein
VVDDDLGGLDFYGDQVRHPALDLRLFTASMPGGGGEVDDDIDDDDAAHVVPADQVQGAPQAWRAAGRGESDL